MLVEENQLADVELFWNCHSYEVARAILLHEMVHAVPEERTIFMPVGVSGFVGVVVPPLLLLLPTVTLRVTDADPFQYEIEALYEPLDFTVARYNSFVTVASVAE